MDELLNIVESKQSELLHKISEVISDASDTNDIIIMHGTIKTMGSFLELVLAFYTLALNKIEYMKCYKDRFTVMQYVKISKEMIQQAKTASIKTRSQKWKDYYSFKESCLLLTNIIDPTTGKIMFSRDLDYGFSLTSHKSQGSTFDTSLVDVNDIVYDKFGQPYTDAEEINRRLYVACSHKKNKLYLKYGR